jgi:membrane protein DedA with SNARE-associated domain
MTDFIVDPLVEFCVDVIGEIGYLGIFLLMLVESANIPMPSEATMLFAGFKVEEGDLTLFGIVAAGVLGNVVGSWAGYAIGYYGREELLERHRIFHVSPKQMERVERWFDRYGSATVFFTRMLPIVRTFISTPAGAAHMNLTKFTLYTAAGCVPWVLLLGVIGVEVGERWEEWRDKLHYFDYAVIAAIIGLVIYLLIRRRGGGEPSGEAEPATEA